MSADNPQCSVDGFDERKHDLEKQVPDLNAVFEQATVETASGSWSLRGIWKSLETANGLLPSVMKYGYPPPLSLKRTL